MKASPIMHTDCGNTVMWYVGDKFDNETRAEDIRYLDGETPEPGSLIPPCPFCGGQMARGHNLERLLDDEFSVDHIPGAGK